MTVRTASPTITVDRRGRLVVTVANASARAVIARVRAMTAIGGKQVVIATRTVKLGAKRSAKVALPVSATARRRLGRVPRALAITATPLGARTGRASSVRLTLKP